MNLTDLNFEAGIHGAAAFVSAKRKTREKIYKVKSAETTNNIY